MLSSYVDRVQVNSVLLVLCFLSLLLLESQSAASYSTYLLAIGMALSLKHWNDVFRERLTWLVMLLLGYLSLSSFWSEPFHWRDVASVVSRAALTFAFVVAFAECRLRGQLRRWLGRAMAVAGTAAVIAAIAVFVLTDPEDGRLNGLGQLDTHVVAALVFGAVLILVLDVATTDRSRPWRLLALVSLPMIAYSIFLSDSRNAWVGAIAGSGVYLLARRVHDPQRFVVGVLSLALVLVVAFSVLIIDESTRNIVLPRGASYRPEIWSQAIERIADGSWLIGLGINTPDSMVIDGTTFLHPHNLYISIVYQGGLLALGLFLLLLLVVFGELLRRYDDDDAKLALGLLALALPAYILDGHELIDKIGSTWVLLWLPVAIALGYSWARPREHLL